MRHRVQAGCRVRVPLGSRVLTGVVLRTHDDAPAAATKPVQRLLDEAPIFDAHLIELARWASAYYCAPLGEVFRGMAPLGGEASKRKRWMLTDAGRDVARQLTLGGDSTDGSVVVLRLLEERPLSESTLAAKVEKAASILKSLAKKSYVTAEVSEEARDPLRSPSDRLEAEFARRATSEKLTKRERELLAYLELHPGRHRLDQLEQTLPDAAAGARALARKQLAKVTLIAPAAGMVATVPHTLNTHQQAAFDAIAEAVRARRFAPFLLHGVTGAGKTEVYLRAIDACLQAGRSAMLLVPEIALTPAVAANLSARFGERLAILHSAFNDTERAAQWRRIHAGEVTLAVGTRSAVFAPLRNLGLLIVDEEHDGSYKQEETPRYHGRDLAVVRGSATPSLESRYNVELGKYALLELPERVEARPMPQVEKIDMRVEFLETRSQATFSRRMLDALKQRLDAGEQSMLLLNRRGFSSFVTCRSCGERVMCVNCAITLTYHRRDRRMLCHLCNYAEKVPSKCPKCDSEHVYFAGTGSERVEDELHQALPGARIVRMDRDTVTGKHQAEAILQGFRAHDYDILVGTQMIAKGHDIPNVTLVGIVNADVGLGMPDFRAAERTFQLLTQAAGRAGRGQVPGQVLLQTINPDHYAVDLAAAQDYRGFYEREIQFRRAMRYPPFAALANVVVRAEQKEDALRWSGELGNLLTPAPEKLKVLGPSEAAVPRIKREYRYQMLLKSSSRPALAAVIAQLRSHALAGKWPATALVIDVDPLSLL